MARIKIFLLFLVLIFYFQKAFTYENKIIYKVNNEIITTFDLIKESNYLAILNSNLKMLSEEENLKLASESIIKEKIKKNELEKYFSLGENLDDPVIGIILENLYRDMGIDSEEQFNRYLKNSSISINWVKRKIEIENLWNNLIYKKYKNQILIDENRIRKELERDVAKQPKQKKILLAEILIKITKKEEQQNLIKEVTESIKEIGFENTANIYSVSQTSNKGGRIGWIDESSLSTLIAEQVANLKKDEITQPIKLTNGFLILKIIDLKKTTVKIDMKNALNKRIINEQNRQLNQLSIVYFNKIKTGIKINVEK